jgi:hypothetical protein
MPTVELLKFQLNLKQKELDSIVPTRTKLQEARKKEKGLSKTMELMDNDVRATELRIIKCQEQQQQLQDSLAAAYSSRAATKQQHAECVQEIARMQEDRTASVMQQNTVLISDTRAIADFLEKQSSSTVPPELKRTMERIKGLIAQHVDLETERAAEAQASPLKEEEEDEDAEMSEGESEKEKKRSNEAGKRLAAMGDGSPPRKRSALDATSVVATKVEEMTRSLDDHTNATDRQPDEPPDTQMLHAAAAMDAQAEAVYALSLLAPGATGALATEPPAEGRVDAATVVPERKRPERSRSRHVEDPQV